MQVRNASNALRICDNKQLDSLHAASDPESAAETLEVPAGALDGAEDVAAESE